MRLLYVRLGVLYKTKCSIEKSHMQATPLSLHLFTFGNETVWGRSGNSELRCLRLEDSWN